MTEYHSVAGNASSKYYLSPAEQLMGAFGVAWPAPGGCRFTPDDLLTGCLAPQNMFPWFTVEEIEAIHVAMRLAFRPRASRASLDAWRAWLHFITSKFAPLTAWCHVFVQLGILEFGEQLPPHLQKWAADQHLAGVTADGYYSETQQAA